MKIERQKSPTDPRNGFTLIEVLIVIAIFSIGILGAMSMQVGSTFTNTNTSRSTLAMEYATDTMERLMQVGESLEDKFNVDDDGDGAMDEADEEDDGIDNDNDGTVDNEISWHRLAEFQEGTGYTRGGNILEDAYYDSIFDLNWDVTDIDCDGDGTNDAKRIDITVTYNNGANTLQLTNVRTSIL